MHTIVGAIPEASPAPENENDDFGTEGLPAAYDAVGANTTFVRDEHQPI